MAGNIEVAKAFVTIVPSLEGSQATITKELTGVTSEASEKAGKDGGSKFGEHFASALKGAGAAIGAAMTAATAAAGAATKKFVDSAKEVANYGDEIDKTSQKLGISSKSYQEWDYVMKICGTEMSSMTTGMKTLTNKLDDAKNGSEQAQAMFAALGLSMEDLNSLSREDLFEAAIAGFQGMADSTERAALANDLFGKAGQNLAPLFNMTSEDTADLIDKANDLGMIMGEDDVKSAAAFKDAMTTLEGALTGLKNNIMIEFLPGLTTLSDGLAAVFAGDESGMSSITAGLQELVSKLTTMAPKFLQLGQTIITSLISGFGPMLPQLAAAIFGVLNQALVTLTGMLPQLLPVIKTGISATMKSVMQCLPIILTSLFELITDLAKWLSEDDNIHTFVQGVLDLITLIANQLDVILPILLPAVVKIIGQVAVELSSPQNIQTLLTAVVLVLKALVDGIIAAAPDFVMAIYNIGQQIYNTISGFINWLADLITPGLEFFINKFRTWGESVKTWVLGLSSNIKTSFSTWLTNIKTAFSDGFTAIKDKISSIITNIKDFVTNAINTLASLPEKAKSIGSQLMEGLIGGIKDKTQWVIDLIGGVGDKITSKLKKTFKIASPSKTFAEIGGYLAEGLGVGWSDEIGDVENEMIKSADGLTASMTGTVTAVGTTGASSLEGGTTINAGGNTINVYASEGQDVNQLAEVISEKLDEMARRRGAVYA